MRGGESYTNKCTLVGSLYVLTLVNVEYNRVKLINNDYLYSIL